ncbi:hypothetical protein RUM43_013447 [Polyplax serrata]|uniref:Uncharacterized protein n=1 Tax=Polyplax serrata TaxID=468196 RepID=A0AAN8P0N8_POLSC
MAPDVRGITTEAKEFLKVVVSVARREEIHDEFDRSKLAPEHEPIKYRIDKLSSFNEEKYQKGRGKQA